MRRRTQDVRRVRMGPVSIFALLVALCLAVMAVLAVATARASLALAERQATFTTDDYANEAAGQELLARVRAVAADAAAGGADARQAVATRLGDLLADLEGSGDETAPVVSAVADGETVQAQVVSTASGRRLDVTLAVAADGTVEVRAWRATTTWDTRTDDVLWSGPTTDDEE